MPEDGEPEEAKEEEALPREPFPWRSSLLLLFLVGLFMVVGDRNMALSNWTPALNVVAMLAFLVYVAMSLSK